MFNRRLARTVALAGAALILSACGGGGGGSAPPPAPPVTTASPAGGIYAASQSVTLTANTPATIYYSVNGVAPSIGAANTLSGPSPIANIPISSDTVLLQFFAVSSAGTEAVKSESYAVSGGAASGPGDPQGYFPLTPGNSWTAAVTYSDTETPPGSYSDTTSITGSKPVGAVTALVSTESNPGNTGFPAERDVLKSSNGVVLLGLNDAADPLTGQFLPYHSILFPLQTGASFVAARKSGIDFGEDLDGDGRNETADVNATVTVKGYESVAVPAGTFSNSAKVETVLNVIATLSETGIKIGATSVQTQWLAPGLGPVKETITTTSGTFSSAQTNELTSAILAAPFFGSAASFAAGVMPNSVAVGDFNGDGKPDLAITNQGNPSSGFADSSVSVLLGDGAGAFGAAVNLAAGSFPISVAVGDFNGDGKADLAVANFGGNSVSVLPGNGDGTFGAATSYAVAAGTNPTSVAVGDFNGDGKLDLAVATGYPSNSTPGFVSILLGTGTGAFGTESHFTAGGEPRWVAAGDFNGDGKLDLAVANALGNSVSILLGDGSGSFGTASNLAFGFERPAAVAVGDFNGDGQPDLAVTVNSSLINDANVSVVLGDGAGSFGAPIRYVVDPIMGGYLNGIAIADFNRDGKLDVAVTNSGTSGIRSNSISVLVGRGDGTLAKAPAYFAAIGDQPAALAAGDFNGDGKPDLAAPASMAAAILLNTAP